MQMAVRSAIPGVMLAAAFLALGACGKKHHTIATHPTPAPIRDGET